MSTLDLLYSSHVIAGAEDLLNGGAERIRQAQDRIRQALRESLSGIQTEVNFATSDRVFGDVATGLTVNGFGHIAFPLPEHQAKQIIKICHKAPFGKGSNTLVDENIRKTWELNPDQFTLTFPRWPSIMSDVTKKAAQKLGLPPKTAVTSNLYKLLLYEKGAMFKPHQDTEKEPGMFATLIITLPSYYEGGAVVVTHCGHSKTLEVESPAFFHSYLAWYADVTHEIQPITSGYRLVLVYNLIKAPGGCGPSASSLATQRRELTSIIKDWNDASNAGDKYVPEALMYKLDHKYTDANISLQALKGLDKVKADYLKEACAEVGLCFYLASMQFEREGGCDEDEDEYDDEDDDEDDEDEDEAEDEDEDCGKDRGRLSSDFHEIEELVDEKLSLRRMVDLEGNVLAHRIRLDEGDIVQEEPFARDPDKEDYSGYTGNEGVSATHWYNDTVSHRDCGLSPNMLISI